MSSQNNWSSKMIVRSIIKYKAQLQLVALAITAVSVSVLAVREVNSIYPVDAGKVALVIWLMAASYSVGAYRGAKKAVQEGNR